MRASYLMMIMFTSCLFQWGDRGRLRCSLVVIKYAYFDVDQAIRNPENLLSNDDCEMDHCSLQQIFPQQKIESLHQNALHNVQNRRDREAVRLKKYLIMILII